MTEGELEQYIQMHPEHISRVKDEMRSKSMKLRRELRGTFEDYISDTESGFHDDDTADEKTIRAMQVSLYVMKQPEGFIDGQDAQSTPDGFRDQDGRLTFPKSELRIGEVFHAMAQSATKGYVSDKLRQYLGETEKRAITGQGESIPSDGGFLLSATHENTILQRIHAESTLANKCDRYVIGANSNSLELPYPDEASRATGSRWGGVTGYRADEGGALTASSAKWGKLTLSLNKLTALVYATSEIVQDSKLLEQYIMTRGPSELAFLTDNEILNGDGAGKNQGIITSNCIVSVTKESGQTANTLVYENVINAWARMWPVSRQRAIWIANSDIIPQLYSLGLSIGVSGSAVFTPQGGASARPFDVLFGRPILYHEAAPTLGDKGDLLLADMSQYIYATKDPEVQSAVSIHVRFTNDEVVFRFVTRNAGQPWWSSTLTPFKGSSTVSPFVAIAARD